MNSIETNEEYDMPLHLQLAMRKAELDSQEMTWDQLQVALLCLFHKRLIETQAIKDMLAGENIDIEFDIPTDFELTQLALTMMQDDDEDESNYQPF
jgi:hypothetical protein